ncbi:MAG TPA: oligosaccharide flippase family protein [Nitrososphaerales archaeon]|nr:oligosaccharide flippase family protein [Nitrososphaerales archaeon]
MQIAKRSAKGSAVLFTGNLVASSIAAIGSAIIARLLSPDNFGLFSLALVTPTLLQLFTHFGTRTASTKFVAHNLAIGEVEKARQYGQTALAFSLCVGVVMAFVNYASSWWVASTLFQRPELQPYIALLSLYLIGASIGLVVVAVATGWNAMGQASLVNILWALLKLIIAPILIVAGLGVSGAVLGQSFAFLIAALGSAALLFYTRLKFSWERFRHFAADSMEMLKFGFAPFIGNLMGGLSTFYVSVLLALVATNTKVGLYQAALNLITPATLLAAATTSALYPAFASLHATKEDTARAFGLSVKYVSFLIGPVLFFLAAAAPQLMYLIYGAKFVSGSNYLLLLSLAYAPIIIGQSVIPSFLNGIGRTRLTFVTTGSAAIFLFVAAPLLSVYLGLGVMGLILSLLVSNSALAAVGLYVVHRYGLGVTAWRAAVATLLAAGAGLVVCFFIPTFIHPLVTAVVKLGVFGLIYLTLAPMLGAVDGDDIDRLVLAIGEIRGVGTVSMPFLRYARAVVKRTRRSQARSETPQPAQ